MKKIIIFIFVICTFSAKADVYINELMPSNINTVVDDLYDFPDSWVEFYNSEDTAINLKNHFLSNDKDDLMMWRITNDFFLPANGYAIYYLDGESENFHANFSLDIKGESLYLTDTDGKTIIDSSKKFDKNMSPNLSFGRATDGGKTWAWLRHATPGKSNNTVASLENDAIAPEPKFNIKGGIYDAPFILKLSLNDKYKEYSDKIYYTLDGSEPDENSFHYSDSITIDTTTIIRAKVLSDSLLPRMSSVQSYIFKEHELTLPVVSIVTDSAYLWDDTMGIYCDGKNGVFFPYINDTVNWFTDRRRPMNIEYYDDSEQAINQLGEMRIHGNASRIYPMKSFVIHANKRFGTKRLNYKFFKEKNAMDDGYKSLLLRNAGQDFDKSFICDAFVQMYVSDKLDIDYMSYQPAVTFINGQYWGIMNVRERSNDHNILSNYGDDDIDMIENCWEVSCGMIYAFNDLINLTSSEFTYDELDKVLDIQQTINYFIIETFFQNFDWGGYSNNSVIWRNRDGGKWRWLLKDLDQTMGHSMDLLAQLKTDTTNSVILKMMFGMLENEQFKNEFIDRYSVYLGDIFHKELLQTQFDSLVKQIEPEMPFHRTRWEQEMDTWYDALNMHYRFINKRQNDVYNHLDSFFTLGTHLPLEVASTQDYSNISVCNIPLYRKSFDGQWFIGRPLQLKTDTMVNDEIFKYWQVDAICDSDTITSYINECKAEIILDTVATRYRITAVYENGIIANETIPTKHDNLQCYSINRILYVISQHNKRNAAIYSLNGTLVCSVQLNKGINTIPGLQTGVYIISTDEESRKAVVK